MNVDLATLVVLAPLLLLTAYFDLRSFRIPNFLPLAAVALFVVSAPFLGAGAEIWLRLAAAAAMLLAGFVLFAAGMMGGGDAKMLAAVALYVPNAAIGQALYSLAFTGLAGLLLIWALRPLVLRLAPAGVAEWEVWGRRRHFPYGFAIAGALLLLFGARAFGGGAAFGP